MRAIANFLWFVLGGFLCGLLWWVFGVVALLTIVGIPWAKACFVIGQFSFLPFGREAIGRVELGRPADIGTSAFGTLGNIVWFVLAGVWLALAHVLIAIVDVLLIIGIPFAIQHLKLAGIALAPIGKAIVHIEVADAARRANADATVAGFRRRRADASF
jgi:uncharacterized membrane protein YccF (DUF307 family)